MNWSTVSCMPLHQRKLAYANRAPMRFNPANRGAWYAPLCSETCIAEVGHHLTLALADTGDFNAVVDYGEMLASMSGLFIDLRAAVGHAALDPDPATGYAAGNALAAEARAQGHNGTIHPSVRHLAGFALQRSGPTSSSRWSGNLVRLIWEGSPDYRWEALWRAASASGVREEEGERGGGQGARFARKDPHGRPRPRPYPDWRHSCH
ncbi:MAG: RES family NAD+ phosphorylase [Sphingomonadales bacterium]|nr:RES family NAD+ phosphorylase [Sphingomonadales bacterium]